MVMFDEWQQRKFALDLLVLSCVLKLPNFGGRRAQEFVRWVNVNKDYEPSNTI